MPLFLKSGLLSTFAYPGRIFLPQPKFSFFIAPCACIISFYTAFHFVAFLSQLSMLHVSEKNIQTGRVSMRKKTLLNLEFLYLLKSWKGNRSDHTLI